MVGAEPTSSDFISEVACLRLDFMNSNPVRPYNYTVFNPRGLPRQYSLLGILQEVLNGV